MTMMIKTLHRGTTRGLARWDWLTSYHTFSFASYQNAERMHFGALRVLNDDVIAAGRGFDMHPHRDMEIISIPLGGALKHRDSEGHEAVIGPGEVQIMSAGTGVLHSEHNASQSEPVSLLQIWILPKLLGIAPRYAQRVLNPEDRAGRFDCVVSPLRAGGEGLMINQDAYFSLIDLMPHRGATYETKTKGHGLYVFVMEGAIEVAGESLGRRDALGLEHAERLAIQAEQASSVLLIEVPML